MRSPQTRRIRASARSTSSRFLAAFTHAGSRDAIDRFALPVATRRSRNGAATKASIQSRCLAL